ncbi:MAG: 4Fe-4S binding protein [Planctomycetota bacterium]
MTKWVILQFDRCDPRACDPREGRCRAVKACLKMLLVQEEPFEPPFHASRELCRGCEECVIACPRGAIQKSP